MSIPEEKSNRNSKLFILKNISFFKATLTERKNKLMGVD
jgi:hypothetical protein